MTALRNPEDFFQSIAGFRQTVLIGLAVDLDLATGIDEGIDEADRLAKRCRVEARALEICLNALCAIGLLKKVKGRYRNSPAARRFLSAHSRQCMKPRLQHMIDSTLRWATLGQTVKAGCATDPPAGARSAEGTNAFIRTMEAHAREVAPAVVDACALGTAATLLDLGGGPGTFALEFLRKHPGLRATVFDLPQALRVTRRILKEKGCASPPFRLRPGNFLTDPLDGPYDIILASNILHMLDEKGCLRLLKKSSAALNRGGHLIIHDFLLDPSKASPTEAALFSVHMLSNTRNGRAYSAEEFRDMLRTVGCRPVRILRNVTPRSGLVLGRRV